MFHVKYSHACSKEDASFLVCIYRLHLTYFSISFCLLPHKAGSLPECLVFCSLILRNLRVCCRSDPSHFIPGFFVPEICSKYSQCFCRPCKP